MNVCQTPDRTESRRDARHSIAGRRRSTSEGEGSARPLRSSSNMKMPPPPPRTRTNSLSSASCLSSIPQLTLKPNQILPLPHNKSKYTLSSGQTTPPLSYVTPPTTPQLMKQGVSSLAATAAPLPLDFGSTVIQNKDQLTVCKNSNTHQKLCFLTHKKLMQSNYDMATKESKNIKKEIGKIITKSSPVVNDTTILLSSSSSSPNLSAKTDAIDYDSNSTEDRDFTKQECTRVISQTCMRERSVSCSVLSSLSMSPGQCDTILEEEFDFENGISSNKEQPTKHHATKKLRSCSLNINEI